MPDDSFKEFVLDQLSALPELRAKAMFGAHGLYADGKFFAMTAMPALIAWLSPRVSTLKRNLGICYTTSALMLLTLAITLAAPVSIPFKLGVVILQGAVSGAVMLFREMSEDIFNDDHCRIDNDAEIDRAERQ